MLLSGWYCPQAHDHISRCEVSRQRSLKTKLSERHVGFCYCCFFYDSGGDNDDDGNGDDDNEEDNIYYDRDDDEMMVTILGTMIVQMRDDQV